MKVSTKVTMPDLTIKPPTSTSYWYSVASQLGRDIRKRTETSKVDWSGRRFKGYSDQYKKLRAKAGRSSTPNLSFSSKMLASMRAIGSKTKSVLRLSGEQGFKAWVNEKNGRIFFAISQKDADKIAKNVSAKVAKDNKLKR